MNEAEAASCCLTKVLVSSHCLWLKGHYCSINCLKNGKEHQKSWMLSGLYAYSDNLVSPGLTHRDFELA